MSLWQPLIDALPQHSCYMLCFNPHTQVLEDNGDDVSVLSWLDTFINAENSRADFESLEDAETSIRTNRFWSVAFVNEDGSLRYAHASTLTKLLSMIRVNKNTSPHDFEGEEIVLTRSLDYLCFQINPHHVSGQSVLEFIEADAEIDSEARRVIQEVYKANTLVVVEGVNEELETACTLATPNITEAFGGLLKHFTPIQSKSLNA